MSIWSYYKEITHLMIHFFKTDYQFRWWRLPIEERACRKTHLPDGDYQLRNSDLPSPLKQASFFDFICGSEVKWVRVAFPPLWEPCLIASTITYFIIQKLLKLQIWKKFTLKKVNDLLTSKKLNDFNALL